MSSLFLRNNIWYIRIKQGQKWIERSTSIPASEKHLAEKVLKAVTNQLQAINDVSQELKSQSPITFEQFATLWISSREDVISDIRNEKSRLKNHILPRLGDKLLPEIRPAHVIDLVKSMKAKNLSPRTIRAVYGILRGIFQDALKRELIEKTPCILTRRDLGRIHDKHPDFRKNAIFSRDEIHQLISNPEIRNERRVIYALLFFTGGRVGEIAGMRWVDIDWKTEPLPKITLCRSYNRPRTKTGVIKEVPMHPELQGILGPFQKIWAAIYDKRPEREDWLVPSKAKGPWSLRIRRHERIYKDFRRDLKTIGLRKRRLHDLRRSFISFCLEDGVNPSILKRFTHLPNQTNMLDVYSSFSWVRVCYEILKLNLTPLRP